MNKVFEIIKREYLTRVRKKSFIVMTVLMPVLMGLLLLAHYAISSLKSGTHNIGVLDESGLFDGKFKNTRNIYFTFVNSDLKTMKKNCILINTARGGIINENDLSEALNKNYIFGAGLDVFNNEPPEKNNPLLKSNKVFLSPHTATFTEDVQKEWGLKPSKISLIF